MLLTGCFRHLTSYSSHLQVKSVISVTFTNLEVLINAVTEALFDVSSVSLRRTGMDLQYTHAHCESNTELLPLVHLQVP